MAQRGECGLGCDSYSSQNRYFLHLLGNRVFESPRYEPVRASHLRTGGVQRACNAAGGDITLKRKPLRTVLKTWHVKETILVIL